MPKVNQDTRAEILKKALLLFMEKGYRDVSYQHLVKKTGLSKGAIYHYFESKEALLWAVFEFLVEATKQPAAIEPQKIVTDQESFVKLFIDIVTARLESFKNLMGGEPIKVNKLLFFIEAINENGKLKPAINDLIAHEKAFIEDFFIGLKNHNQLQEGKDTALLAECLYWMLEGAETTLLYTQGDNWEGTLFTVYRQTIDNFFKII
jgi:AcrR family transcriptional regulator